MYRREVQGRDRVPRKSTYTMLRVDEEALQKIRSDKDLELLSVAGEHVVFISSKSDLGQSEGTLNP